MVVWIIAVSLAGIFFFQGEAIMFSVFSGPLSHDTFGFVRQLVGIMAFSAKYLLPPFILALTYNLRNSQMLHLQTRVMGAPSCPRCGRRMRFRTAAYGLFFWDHYWGCPHCRCRESIEPWEISE